MRLIPLQFRCASIDRNDQDISNGVFVVRGIRFKQAPVEPGASASSKSDAKKPQQHVSQASPLPGRNNPTRNYMPPPSGPLPVRQGSVTRGGKSGYTSGPPPRGGNMSAMGSNNRTAPSSSRLARSAPFVFGRGGSSLAGPSTPNSSTSDRSQSYSFPSQPGTPPVRGRGDFRGGFRGNHHSGFRGNHHSGFRGNHHDGFRGNASANSRAPVPSAPHTPNQPRRAQPAPRRSLRTDWSGHPTNPKV